MKTFLFDKKIEIPSHFETWFRRGFCPIQHNIFHSAQQRVEENIFFFYSSLQSEIFPFRKCNTRTCSHFFFFLLSLAAFHDSKGNSRDGSLGKCFQLLLYLRIKSGNTIPYHLPYTDWFSALNLVLPSQCLSLSRAATLLWFDVANLPLISCAHIKLCNILNR